MKKISIALVFFTLILAGCDYHVKLDSCETGLNLTITENCGFLVTVEAQPDEDNVCYMYSIYESAVYDSIISSCENDAEWMQAILDGYNETYETLSGYYELSGHQYISEFHDVMLYYARSEQTFADLIPETEYTVFGFCVDPYAKTPVGGVQIIRFKTSKIPEDALDMTFDFMIQDTKGSFYYYVKPTYHGTLCKDFYFTNIVSEEVLDKDYDGDLYEYIYSEYALYSKLDLLNVLLSYDITRHQDKTVHYNGEGTPYVLFAVPYNPKYKERIYTYHFEYKAGMQTSYTHDE